MNLFAGLSLLLHFAEWRRRRRQRDVKFYCWERGREGVFRRNWDTFSLFLPRAKYPDPLSLLSFLLRRRFSLSPSSPSSLAPLVTSLPIGFKFSKLGQFRHFLPIYFMADKTANLQDRRVSS